MGSYLIVINNQELYHHVSVASYGPTQSQSMIIFQSLQIRDVNKSVSSLDLFSRSRERNFSISENKD